MAYNKAQVQAVGEVIVRGIDAVRDGIDVNDATVGIEFLTALIGAADEIRTDTDAAALHIASVITDKFGDRRVNAEPVV